MRSEVFSQEKFMILDNLRILVCFCIKGFSKMKSTMYKGHKRQFALLNERMKEGGEPLISFGSIVNTTKASFACIQSLKENRWVEIE